MWFYKIHFLIACLVQSIQLILYIDLNDSNILKSAFLDFSCRFVCKWTVLFLGFHLLLDSFFFLDLLYCLQHLVQYWTEVMLGKLASHLISERKLAIFYIKYKVGRGLFFNFWICFCKFYKLRKFSFLFILLNFLSIKNVIFY